jgi:hypothetical protein
MTLPADREGASAQQGRHTTGAAKPEERPKAESEVRGRLGVWPIGVNMLALFIEAHLDADQA